MVLFDIPYSLVVEQIMINLYTIDGLRLPICSGLYSMYTDVHATFLVLNVSINMEVRYFLSTPLFECYQRLLSP